MKKRVMSMVLALALMVSLIAAVGVTASAGGLNTLDEYWNCGHWLSWDCHYGTYCPASGWIPCKDWGYSKSWKNYSVDIDVPYGNANASFDAELYIGSYSSMSYNQFKRDTIYATVPSTTSWIELGADLSDAPANVTATVNVERYGSYGSKYYYNGKYYDGWYCDGKYYSGGYYPISLSNGEYWLSEGRNNFKITITTKTTGLTDKEQGFLDGHKEGYQSADGYTKGYKAGALEAYTEGYNDYITPTPSPIPSPITSPIPGSVDDTQPEALNVVVDNGVASIGFFPGIPSTMPAFDLTPATPTTNKTDYQIGKEMGLLAGKQEGYDDGLDDGDNNTYYSMGMSAAATAAAANNGVKPAMAAPDTTGWVVPTYAYTAPVLTAGSATKTSVYYAVIDREEAEDPTYTITSTCNVGGKVSDEKLVVDAGDDATVKFTPSTGYIISKVVVDGIDKGPITSYTFEDVSKNHAISIYFLPLDTVEEEKEEEVKFVFSDLPSTHWAYNYVKTLVQGGVVSGYPDNTFKPDGQVTWGEALKLVTLACGNSEQTPGANEYWATGYMNFAIAKGYIDGAVDLRAAITREEIAELAAAAMELGEPKDASPFADCDLDAASALYEKGVITGSYDDSGKLVYKPASSLTRAEFSAIICRIYDIND